MNELIKELIDEAQVSDGRDGIGDRSQHTEVPL